MSRKGNCRVSVQWDNAVAESFFKTIKYEELNHHKFDSYEQLYDCIEQYIGWYNTKRIHASLGYQTPLEKEIKMKTPNKKRVDKICTKFSCHSKKPLPKVWYFEQGCFPLALLCKKLESQYKHTNTTTI